MRGIIFSIGEPTTKLCEWSLSRLGIDTEVWQDSSSFYDKLQRFYEIDTDEILRVDADVIVNKRVLDFLQVEDECYWHQAIGIDWYTQSLTNIAINHYKRPALELGRLHIGEYKEAQRPETAIWRLQELHNPRRCYGVNIICGLHGYGNQPQRIRVRDQKRLRGQEMDWELIREIEKL